MKATRGSVRNPGPILPTDRLDRLQAAQPDDDHSGGAAVGAGPHPDQTELDPWCQAPSVSAHGARPISYPVKVLRKPYRQSVRRSPSGGGGSGSRCPSGMNPICVRPGLTAVVVPRTTRGVAAPGHRARPNIRLATRGRSMRARAGSHRRELPPRPTVAGQDARLAGGRSDIGEP
jgi:hypothetical protein